MAIELTDSNFEEKVIKSGKSAVVDFWAEWCGPCRMIAPIIAEMSEEYGDKAVIGKVDVDNNTEITSRFGIRNIPTILFFKNGELVDKQVGYANKAAISSKLDAIL